MDMNLSKLREMVKHREAWHAEVHGVTKSWLQLSNWTQEIDNTIEIVFGHQIPDDPEAPITFGSKNDRLW